MLSAATGFRSHLIYVLKGNIKKKDGVSLCLCMT
jgi:hypothetical protein